MSDDYESILLIKNNVNIYKIPPISGIQKYKAADWKLDNPDWNGRLKLISLNNKCSIKFEDTTGKLFAICPIEKYPSNSIEGVSDSSRYFVVKLQNDNGRSAFVGLGFLDRADSFDLNVALQSHFRWLKDSKEIEKHLQEDESHPKVDLSFKEGQTIKLNITAQKIKDSPNASAKIKPTCFVKIPTASNSHNSMEKIIKSSESMKKESWESF